MSTGNHSKLTRTDDASGSLVRTLAEVRASDVALVGGKGAHLGELIHAGLPVPPGFALLTTAYRVFVAEHELDREIQRLAHAVSPYEFATVEAASRAIRALIERSEMPDGLVLTLHEVYAGLGRGDVAIRSSATDEDLLGASFAGQFDTFLNINGEASLIAAVKACWASLWTSRAIAYRARQRIDPAGVSLAVIIQQMVPADAAGILFTLEPVSGDRDIVVINAAWGLGEAIVGGRVAPDIIMADKATGRVKSVVVGDKAVQTVPVESGTAEMPVDLERRTLAVLSEAQVAELTRFGREIEAHFGMPQDIEWALAADRIVILQTRPVTAHGARLLDASSSCEVPGNDRWPPLNEGPPMPYDLWTRANVGENLPHPVSPLTWSALAHLYGPANSADASASNDGQSARRLYGRVYFNEGGVRHLFTQRYGLPSSLLDRAWGSRRVDIGTAARFRPLRLARSLPVIVRQMNAQRTNQPRRLKPVALFAEIDRWTHEFLERDLLTLSDHDLWDEMARVWRRRNGQAFASHVGVSIKAAVSYMLLEWAASWRGGSKPLAHDLVTGLAGIYSAEIGPTLWQMASSLSALGLSEIVLENPPEVALAQLLARHDAEPIVQRLDAFLERHGHRCPNELELLHPRWAEAPAQVIALVASYLRAGDQLSPEMAESQARQRREQAVATIETALDPLRRGLFRILLGQTQAAVRLRDNSRHYTVKAGFPPRLIYAELGRRWTQRGWLGDPSDIFFLVVGEVEAVITAGLPSAAGLDLPNLVAGRRLAYEHWFQITSPDMIGPDGVPVAQEEDVPSPKELRGLPASGGRAHGRARVISDPRAVARIQPGDILVARATDPGWTPVFPLVSGLVLDIGGQLSHGAIVAREYGVPAVVNVHGATEHICDGQMITVDGTTGRVLLDVPDDGR